jgi:glycosyltransferase involved in cell wall biosynthesis
MVLVEGMALGKPCIGASRGGIPEVIADGITGLVREPTPKTFSEAMNLFVSFPEMRQTMGAQAKRRVEGTFALTQQAIQLEAALDRSCAKATL